MRRNFLVLVIFLVSGAVSLVGANSVCEGWGGIATVFVGLGGSYVVGVHVGCRFLGRVENRGPANDSSLFLCPPKNPHSCILQQIGSFLYRGLSLLQSSCDRRGNFRDSAQWFVFSRRWGPLLLMGYGCDVGERLPHIVHQVWSSTGDLHSCYVQGRLVLSSFRGCPNPPVCFSHCECWRGGVLWTFCLVWSVQKL